MPEFAEGDKVFAKLRGYPPWPARVEGISEVGRNKLRYCVFFYGTCELGYVRPQDVLPYLENRDKLGSPKKKNKYGDALLQIEEELNGPPKYFVIEKDNSKSKKGKKRKLATNGESFSPSSGGEGPVELQKGSRKRKSGNNDENLPPTKKTPSRPRSSSSLKLLEIEKQMKTIDTNIKKCLSLKKADLRNCLKFLDELAELKMTQVMLKKNPTVVETIKKTRKYVGNTANWAMSPEEEEEFRDNCEEVRQKSVRVYNRFREIFKAPKTITFWEHFAQQLEIFHTKTENLSLKQIEYIVKEPPA